MSTSRQTRISLVSENAGRQIGSMVTRYGAGILRNLPRRIMTMDGASYIMIYTDHAEVTRGTGSASPYSTENDGKCADRSGIGLQTMSSRTARNTYEISTGREKLECPLFCRP